MIMKTNRGFTLVELIVSLGIFTAVMFIATGALLSIINVNKKAQAQQSAINNINFALENMARNIRTGSSYVCSSDGDSTILGRYSGTSIPPSQDDNGCSTGGTALAFNSNITGNSDVDTWAYVFKEVNGKGSIWKLTSIPCTVSCTAPGGPYTQQIYQVTADEIDIDKLRFVVEGTGTGDGQPRVVINIVGHAFVNENVASPRRVDFSLQTTASQRALDK